MKDKIPYFIVGRNQRSTRAFVEKECTDWKRGPNVNTWIDDLGNLVSYVNAVYQLRGFNKPVVYMTPDAVDGDNLFLKDLKQQVTQAEGKFVSLPRKKGKQS